MKIEEKFVETKFGKICYLEAGEGDKILVFLHGTWGYVFGRLAIYPWLVEHYTPIGYKVIAPSLPGHWGSFNLTDKFSFNDLVKTTSEFIKKIEGNKNVYIIGHSLGASVALALRGILKIEKIAVLDPMLYFIHEPVAKRFTGWFKDRLTDRFGKPGIKLGKSTDVFSYIFHWRSYWGLIKSIDTRSYLKQYISVPILVLWGSQDHVCPLKVFEEDLKKIPNVTLKTHSGGHWWYNFQKEALLKDLDEFLL